MKQIPFKDDAFQETNILHILLSLSENHMSLPLRKHCRLFNLAVVKMNILKKKWMSSLCFSEDLLVFMSVSSWSAVFLESSSCAETCPVFFICPFYSTVLLFYFQSSITNLVSCHLLRA